MLRYRDILRDTDVRYAHGRITIQKIMTVF